MTLAPLADLALLERDVRGRVSWLLVALHAVGIPLEQYETARPPARQGELYAIGREPRNGELGHTRTDSLPWHSAHQWGLAVDLVFRVNGRWTWVEPEDGMWDHMHELARKADLRGLRNRKGQLIEMPHVQPANLWPADIAQLPRGPNDTEGWLAWLRGAGGLVPDARVGADDVDDLRLGPLRPPLHRHHQREP